MLSISKVDINVHRMKGNDLEQTAAMEGSNARFSWDGARGTFGIDRASEGIIGRLDFSIDQQNCEPNDNLAFERPVTLRLHTDMKPLAVTSLYLFGDWWTRPAFSADFRGVPERTQVALIQMDGGFACFVPMVGTEFKAVMGPGGEDWITLALTAGRGAQSSVHEPLFICTEADDIFEAIHKAFQFLTRERNIRMRADRQYPEMFDYLGWCSWDAFYRDVDENGVRGKSEELQEKQTKIRWLLIDDGWLSTKDSMLWDYAPDPQKFHGDFTNLIRDIKSETDIEWVGVWRALSGYWAGVHPEGPLAHFSKEDLLFANNGRVLPAPDTERAFSFSNKWHRELRSFGVDFVKVDVQGAVKNHYEGNASMCSASRALLEGLEASTSWFNGAMINCMGMAMEDILSRPNSAVSRNSDDFLPRKEESFREHLLQNAYNSLYHGEIYWCDWDMFWTSHPHAKKHALLRAISGGPVYASDKVGETNPEILRPLAYEDGRILRMARPALPMAECVFEDPEKSGVLQLANVTQDGLAAVAAFNLTDAPKTCTFDASKIPGIAQDAEYVIYDWFGQCALCRITQGQAAKCELAPNGVALFQIVPWGVDGACFGRADKYMGIAALEGQHVNSDGVTRVLREQGPVVFVGDEIERVYLYGSDVTDALVPVSKEGGIPTLLLQLPVAPARAVIRTVPRKS